MLTRKQPPLHIAVDLDEEDFIAKVQFIVGKDGHWALEEEMEEACTWFWIGPLNVLGGPMEGGSATPPALLAFYGMAALRRLQQVGDAALGIWGPGEELDFRREGACTLIQGGMLFDPVSVAYEPLLAAWQRYHDRVRELMRQYDPNLITLRTHGEYSTGRLWVHYEPPVAPAELGMW